MNPPDLFNQPSLPDTYYNTTSQKGEDLKERHKKVGNQNAEVLAIMRKLGLATPSQVHSSMSTSAPLTSIRRAISTLTDEGLLIKTEEKKMGPYKHPEHVWKVV